MPPRSPGRRCSPRVTPTWPTTCGTGTAFQQAVAEAFSAWTTAVAARLVDRGVPAEQAQMLADAIIAGMEGATVMARAQRDPQPLKHTAAALQLAIPGVIGSAQ